MVTKYRKPKEKSGLGTRMKVPAQSSLIQSIVSLQDVSRAGQPPAARGDRHAYSDRSSGQSQGIGVDEGGRSFAERAARPNPVEGSDTTLQARNATDTKKPRALKPVQREVPNITPRADCVRSVHRYFGLIGRSRNLPVPSHRPFCHPAPVRGSGGA